MAAIRSRSKNARSVSGIYGSSVIESRMVKIGWTDARVVRIHTNTDITIKMEVVAIANHGSADKCSYTVIREQDVLIKAGRTVWFARSNRRDGYYYPVTWDGYLGRWMCGCPHRDHGCHHSREVNSYEVQRVMNVRASEERASATDEQPQSVAVAVSTSGDTDIALVAHRQMAAQAAAALARIEQDIRARDAEAKRRAEAPLSSTQYIPDWMMKH